MTHLSKALMSGVCALCMVIPVYALEESGDRSQSYDLAYFDQYVPRSALDMVEQIPGFQLQKSDGKRGLGQGGANILINNERISGKTDAEDQLSRITASAVVRIDIVDGASLDIPGLSGQVANIITKNTGVSGTWEWRPQFRKHLDANLWRGSATVSGETGNLSYSLTFRNNAFRFGNRGRENRSLANGILFETRDEDSEFSADSPGIATSLTWNPRADHIAHLNAEYNVFNFNQREQSLHTAFTGRGNDDQTIFSNSTDQWNIEVGGDYEFPMGPPGLNGKLKLIGFYKFDRSPNVSRFDTFDQTGQISGSRFFRDADSGETIGRAEYSWSAQQGRDWQFGLEGAFNFLDVTSSLLLLDPVNDNFFEVPISGATSRVEEKRAEATLTHSRALSPKWDVQISGGVEYSELSQSGSAGLSRDFVRPKGFIAATYKANDHLDIRTKVEREVGQLNFSDFISSLSLQDNLNSTGNTNLVPEQKWLGEIEFDQDFGRGNTFKARIYGGFISDLVDRIPVGVDGDAVGNIDSAQRYGIDFDITLKGEQWNLNGTQLDLVLDLRRSHVDDPLTGISRRLNSDKKSLWRIKYRHDIPGSYWAYGSSIRQRYSSRSFRLNTISTVRRPSLLTKPRLSAFIEHKNILGLKVRAEVVNILGARDIFRRQIFTARRDIGILDVREDRARSVGQTLQIDISGTF
jgi:hypothetical protein